MPMLSHTAADAVTAEQRTPEDIQNGWHHMQQIWQELTEAGELVTTGADGGRP
ncbi:MAG TPA: hypothetical protein VFC19_40130 [Candidatus Limnocylindrales bacterium]|nr:hypothetical protein [Candidatus Limnocylindrales bacterium]